MLSLKNYNNKKIGILGLGKSGQAALSLLRNTTAKIFIYDDNLCRPHNSKFSQWKHYKEWEWKNLFRVIISPGIKIDGENSHECVSLAKENNVVLINEIQLLMERKPKAKIIGVTGTNGKSTLVSLISHILTKNKIKNSIGGNFGNPACLLNDPGPDGVIILELSSYQLLSIPSLNLDLATIINLTPDHLDYHGTFESYVKAKINIIKHLKSDGKIIINKNDQLLKKYIEDFNKFKLKKFFYISNYINFKILKNIFGCHNEIIFNIAYVFCKTLGLDNKKIITCFKSFVPLPHRMEVVFSSKNILVINDSKATNGFSAAAALSTYKNIYWIAGGLSKEGGLGEALKKLQNIEQIFLIGSSAKYFQKQINKVNPKIITSEFKKVEEAVKEIFKKISFIKNKKITVLFSPATASFDQFKNFEHRGEHFKKVIYKTLKKMDLKC